VVPGYGAAEDLNFALDKTGSGDYKKMEAIIMILSKN
jgi:hypothetical protein